MFLRMYVMTRNEMCGIRGMFTDSRTRPQRVHDALSTVDSKTKNDPRLELLVNRQIHRHCHTCRKKSKAECRFNFPQPPMKSTTILYPLGDDVSETEVRKHKDTWKSISKHLNAMKEGEDITFDQLLINLKVTEWNYYLAIQSSLSSSTIFLKRKPL